MTLSSGTRLGPYEILAPLGSGAMGQVYRARDPRLGREVAIKVLPGEFAADADRMRRFTLEARAAGALQHPNIATVFDVGTESGTPYVVQELVAGGTLRERLLKGPLPARQALPIAAGIAAGLAAAHEKGVIHRDLKPENVAMAADGRPQILDFGLARVNRPEPDATIAIDSTAPGMVLGTAAYMAPEQVRGEAVDARTDLFALGSILHEMLSGARPFVRGTAVETMHAILADEPAPLPPAVPAAVARVIARCLEKDPARRFQSARDLAFTLEALGGDGSRSDVSAMAAAPAVGARAGGGAVGRWLVGVLLLAAGLAAGYLGARLTAPAPAENTIRATALSHGSRDYEPAASPDGRTIAFSSVRQGRRSIWLMDLATRSEVKLTEGGDVLPRFSPDGSSILYSHAEGDVRSLFRVPTIGGVPRLVAANAADGDWSPDGTQVAFTRTLRDSAGVNMQVMVAKVDGSAVRVVVPPIAMALQTPRWSADGRRVAVIRAGSGNLPNAVLVVDVASGETREYVAPNRAILSSPVWDGTGDGLLVVEGEGLLAIQRGSSGRLFRLELRSGAFRPLGWLGEFPNVFDMLPDGRLVLSTNAFRQNLREVALGAGSGEGRPVTFGLGIDRQPVYSPDGQWVMFSSNRGGALDLWEVSVATGEIHRITDDPADDWDPAYAPDGKSIYWSSNRTGAFEIWTAGRDGSAPRQVSSDSVDAENPGPTADGRWVVYASGHPQKLGLWRVHTDGTGAELLLSSPVALPDVSPDGRHASVVVGLFGLSARLEVMDLERGRALPHPARIDVIQNFGTAGRSRWMPDGGSLVYLNVDVHNNDRLYRRPLSDWATGENHAELVFPGSEASIESFGISPDGRRIMLSITDWLSGLTIADPVTGVTPRAAPDARGR